MSQDRRSQDRRPGPKRRGPPHGPRTGGGPGSAPRSGQSGGRSDWRGTGRGGGRPGHGEGDPHEAPVLYGIHAVEAALRNPNRAIVRLKLTDNAEHRLGAALAERPTPFERVVPRDLDRLLGPDTVHQGALLETTPLPDHDPVKLALAPGAGPLLVLDQVTDPHNVGAILRSAAVFGAGGLVLTRRHSPPLSGALAKAASGALDLVPVALVPNLARALGALKEAGVRLIGLDGTGPGLLEDEALEGPMALVLGAEGRGLRELTRATCDVLCRIAAPGPLASLNVSNAAAVALHLAAMRRRAAAKDGS